MDNGELQKQTKPYKDVTLLLITAFLVVALGIALRQQFTSELSQGVLFHLPDKTNRLVTHEAGFIVLTGILIAIGIPRLWVCGMAGALYGVWLGAILALASSMTGASILYLFGRMFLANRIEQCFVDHRENRWSKKVIFWSKLFRVNGFWWVLYGRLMPISNATINSILCGCCKVPVRQYMAGSLLGFIPLTLVFTTFGSSGLTGNIPLMLLGITLTGGAIALRWLISQYAFSRTPENSALQRDTDCNNHAPLIEQKNNPIKDTP